MRAAYFLRGVGRFLKMSAYARRGRERRQAGELCDIPLVARRPTTWVPRKRRKNEERRQKKSASSNQRSAVVLVGPGHIAYARGARPLHFTCVCASSSSATPVFLLPLLKRPVLCCAPAWKPLRSIVLWRFYEARSISVVKSVCNSKERFNASLLLPLSSAARFS